MQQGTLALFPTPYRDVLPRLDQACAARRVRTRTPKRVIAERYEDDLTENRLEFATVVEELVYGRVIAVHQEHLSRMVIVANAQTDPQLNTD